MRWLPLILIMALLFYGCVEERQVSITGYEQVESITGTDITGDGVNDIRFYLYSAKAINEEAGLYMRKTVTAYPASMSVKLTTYPIVGAAELQQIKSSVAEFTSLKGSGENICIAKLNLNREACGDESSCVEQCISTTCESASEYNQESFGYELYQFNYNSRELDQLATELQAANIPATQEDKEELAGKLASMLVLSSKLSTSLLFRDDAFGACGLPNYDTSKLRDALAVLGEYELESGSYEYKIILTISGGQEEQFIDLYIKDSPPLLISIEQLSLDVLGNGKLYEKDPLTVGWDGVEANIPHRFVYYDFVSGTEPTEEVLSKWKFAKVKERNFTALVYLNQIYDNPVGQFIFSVSGVVFSLFLFLGYYAAVGAAVSVWVVLLFLIILLAETVYNVLKAVMDKRDIKDVLLDAFGAPMADWRAYVGVGLVLIIAAVLANMFYTSPVDSTEFEMESLMTTLGSDFAGAGVVILFVIGAYTLFLVAEDLLKGALLGKEYYELKGATKEDNLKELSQMRETWQALRMRVEDLSKTGMVVTEEYAIIVSVPVERLEQMIASGKQGMAKQLIRFNQGRLEGLDKRLDEKVNVMNQKWPEWKEELGKVLAGSDNVPLNTLLFIPMQWREWAVEKYISENRAKGYALEGEVIVRREVKVDDLLVKKLRDMVKKGTAKQAVLLAQDAEVFNSFQKGKKTVVDVLFLKLKGYVAALSRKMGGAEVRRFVVSGDTIAAVYVGYNNYQAFIVSAKPKMKEVVEEWNEMVEKLA